MHAPCRAEPWCTPGRSAREGRGAAHARAGHVREEDPCGGKGRERIAHDGQVGTSVYMSPERVGGQDYSFNADVW